MMRGMALAARGEAPFELFDKAGERLSAVREAVLFDGVEFGRGDAVLGQQEQRVVAEAAVAAMLIDDRTVPLAFDDDRLRIISMTHEDDQRDEVRAPINLPIEFNQQFFIVPRIRFGLAGIACRIDARSTAKGFDA